MYLSFILPILVFTVGTYLLFKLHFFFVIHPIRTVKSFLSSVKDKKSRRALSLALAGTLGVGNIFGVAAGIIYGGAGSVFWLVISAIFAAVIKYAECVLSFDSLSREKGGMHLVLEGTFPKRGKHLAALYATACAALALFMGGAMQSGAVVGAFVSVSEKGVLLPSLIFTLVVFLGTLGGGDKIEKITEKVIPLTMIVYIFLAFSSIFANIDSLGNAFSAILNDAFTPKSAAFGTGTFLLLRQISEGFARGILSNEAGCGTSSLAHTRCTGRTPYHAGLSGMCEVFFDTSVLCVLTSMAILSSVSDPQSYTSPMQLVSDAIGNTFGGFSQALLLFSVFAFAYATVICWFYYGSVCSSYLMPKVGSKIFAPAFFAFIIFGGLIPSRRLIDITDILLLVLSALTVSAMIRRCERIKELTDL